MIMAGGPLKLADHRRAVLVSSGLFSDMYFRYVLVILVSRRAVVGSSSDNVLAAITAVIFGLHPGGLGGKPMQRTCK